ncbi:MAG: RNA 2'-phosphotransferase, partial [Syntrophobacteria bacterium]
MAKQRLKELAKIIEYILLHRPDEFGLFLDSDGSLPIKELMWALHEESSWGHVRRGHFKELAHSGLQLAFSIEDSCIRPKIPPERPAPVVTPPKLLFYAVRRKAYPVVLRQGLRPAGRRYLPLATTREMALRIGRRRDEKPVPLTIHAARAHDSGHQFIGCGELLLLVKEMPVRFFSGPA